MRKELTFLELKRLGDQAFAEAHAAIDTARQIAHNSSELNAELKRTIKDFKQLREDSPKLPPTGIEDLAFRGCGSFS